MLDCSCAIRISCGDLTQKLAKVINLMNFPSFSSPHSLKLHWFVVLSFSRVRWSENCWTLNFNLVYDKCWAHRTHKVQINCHRKEINIKTVIAPLFFIYLKYRSISGSKERTFVLINMLRTQDTTGKGWLQKDKNKDVHFSKSRT